MSECRAPSSDHAAPYVEVAFGPDDPRLPAIRDGFLEVLRTRRSVRIFDGTPVPDEIMRSCLDLAVLAPNSSNLQPWEFHWVRSAEKKTELVKACLSQPAAKTAAELVVCVARTRTWPKTARMMLEYFDRIESEGVRVSPSARKFYQDLAKLFVTGPLGVRGWVRAVQFWIQGLSKPTSREPADEHDLEVWAVKSSALACENFMLAMRAHGYDTCPMEGFDGPRVKKLLNLPGDASITMVISAGRRAPNGVYGPQVRFARENFIFEV